ncbi:zinc finger protein 616-like [Topomyia yanbarensis]|uniref:zinc finger protein 616-like n=1 Tax=Topomyia yanbarensis TaxID=2498891 RepID=UPI00273C8314|nr:zinc finger protein 616-like [Topomyia yanbarensis]
MDASDSIANDLQEVPNGDPASYCRLCLSNIDVEALFPDGQGARQEVIDRIHECTGIQITVDEDYASSVCWLCSLSLEEFQRFRERCHRYDILIRQKRKAPQVLVGSVAANISYHVDSEDDNSFDDDYDGEGDDGDGPGLLRITSVQEGFDSVEVQSNESLLEETSFQPDEEDVKPDQDTLASYAENFRQLNNSSETLDSNAETSERRFKCNMCSRSFKNRANLWEHNRLHTGKLPFDCNDCGTTFSRVKSLEAHREKYHSKNSTEDPPLRLKCQFCPRVFPRKGDRTQHMKMGHPDQYNPNDKMDTPSPVISKDRSTPAITSSMPEKSSPVVKKSISTSTPTPSPVPDSAAARFCCNLCTKNFQSVQQLEDHIGLMHPKDGILKCSLCPKTFKSRQTLRMHILNHQGKLPYKCDDCGSRFDRRFYLQKHRDKYHEGDDCQAIQCRFRCKFCPRIFHRKIDRKTHTRMVHLKEIKVKKEKIEQTLSAIQCPTMEDDGEASVHTEVTVNASPAEPSFECLQCGEHFPTSAMLQEHTDDQHKKKIQQQDVKPVLPFRAPLASRMMKIKPIRSSMNVRRPYKCPYCPKTFTQNYVMKEHTFIHTGSLRYRCDECMAMFNRPHYLRAHKQKYHGQNSKFRALKCRYCTRSFVRKQDIKIHERIAHGVISAGNVEREILETERNGGESDGAAGTEDNADGELEPEEDVDMIDEDDDDLGEEVDLDDGIGDIDGGGDIDDIGDIDGDQDDDEDGDEVALDAESIEDDPEIRDVVVTLERIPEDVLQTLDNSNEDDEASVDVESAGSVPPTPRLNVTLHRCPKCLKVFKTRKSLKHHMIYHQNQLPFSCDECGVQFARNRPLQVHKQRYHSEDAPYTGKRFSCDYCPRIFLRDRDKMFHQKTVHSMEKSYANRDESTPELKKSKIKKRKDYVCVVCCDRYESEKSCQRHINEFHPSEALPKTPSESPVPSGLATPVKLEPGTESDDYGNSIIPHSLLPPSAPPPLILNPGLRPYKLCRCTTCVAIFKTREHWNEHIQMHPNVRPHHCEQCLFRRKSRSNRKVTSVGFKCQHCPKVFTKASSLRTHQRLHTSELRFPCDECGMMYDRYRLLQLHKEKYHSEDAMQYPTPATFRCMYCPRTFMRQRDCNFHQESVHAT